MYYTDTVLSLKKSSHSQRSCLLLGCCSGVSSSVSDKRLRGTVTIPDYDDDYDEQRGQQRDNGGQVKYLCTNNVLPMIYIEVAD